MRDRQSLLMLVVLVIGVTGVALWQTGYWARSFVMSDIRERSGDILNLVVENLRGELAKFQYQPSLLAFDPAFERALSDDASADDVVRANEQLAHAFALQTFELGLVKARILVAIEDPGFAGRAQVDRKLQRLLIHRNSACRSHRSDSIPPHRQPLAAGFGYYVQIRGSLP